LGAIRPSKQPEGDQIMEEDNNIVSNQLHNIENPFNGGGFDIVERSQPAHIEK